MARSTLLLLLLALLPSCTGDRPPRFPSGRWVDLSHDFADDTVYWPTAKPFRLQVEFKGITEKGYFYAANFYQASEHGGTHVDAPIHFAEGAATVDKIAVDQLIGPACVVDVSAAALADRDYQVSVADLAAFEETHGRIPDGAILLLNTGYHRFWPDRERYMGTAETGPDAVAKLRFPGLHPDAAAWLVEQRRIGAAGIDTPSIDFGRSTHFQSHQVLFKRNVPALENVAQLDALPPTGALVIALPMKIRGGSGGPCRIVARVPE